MVVKPKNAYKRLRVTYILYIVCFLHVSATSVARVKCLVVVKMYGNSPRTLFIRIMRKSEVTMNALPSF
jgi:hypothetical protein